LPVETLTFLFTDIEGSTLMLRRLGEEAYAQVLADHHRLIRDGLAGHEGEEVGTHGDAFFAVFSSPRACVAAVTQIQLAIESHPWPAAEQVRVRMGVHTGEAAKTVTGLVGLDVHRAARVAAIAHGGQVLLSETAAALVRGSLPAGTVLRDLGVHRLKDLLVDACAKIADAILRRCPRDAQCLARSAWRVSRWTWATLTGPPSYTEQRRRRWTESGNRGRTLKRAIAGRASRRCA
jgi:hypothetical protein